AYSAIVSSTGWMSIGELAIMRRIALVAACCSAPSSRSRLSCLFSRTSLAFPSLEEGLRFFDGDRLVVGIRYLFWIFDFGFWIKAINPGIRPFRQDVLDSDFSPVKPPRFMGTFGAIIVNYFLYLCAFARGISSPDSDFFPLRRKDAK